MGCAFLYHSWLFRYVFALHDLCHKISYCLRRSVLLLPGGVGVGAEGEAGVVVSQHTADSFGICPILESQSRERVAKLVEAEMRPSSWKWKTEHDIIPSRAMVCAIALFV